MGLGGVKALGGLRAFTRSEPELLAHLKNYQGEIGQETRRTTGWTGKIYGRNKSRRYE